MQCSILLVPLGTYCLISKWSPNFRYHTCQWYFGLCILNYFLRAPCLLFPASPLTIFSLVPLWPKWTSLGSLSTPCSLCPCFFIHTLVAAWNILPQPTVSCLANPYSSFRHHCLRWASSDTPPSPLLPQMGSAVHLRVTTAAHPSSCYSRKQAAV